MQGIDIFAANSVHGRLLLQNAINNAIIPLSSKSETKVIINTVKNLTYSFPISDLLNDKLSQLREKIGESLQRDATQKQNDNNVIFMYTVTNGRQKGDVS